MSWISRLLLLLSSATVCLAASSPDSLYLSDYCGKSLTVKRSVILKSTIFQDNNCRVTLEPSTGNNLVAHFNTYRQTSGVAALANIFSGECSSEYIQLYNSFGEKLMGIHGYCKSERPTEHYELGQSGRFEYHSASLTYLSFELLVTETYKKSTSDEECPAGQFDCEWLRNCVDDALKCNGYNNCGSNDDETVGCGPPSSLLLSTLLPLIP
ncbi:uncharacterized protein LOC131937403 [Physella acuta]|uniref:uncharacterized protein LOC131937403 n=1 Tax=Physella acuta TaxID=109671 RepID=UPI0027DD3DD2|nr:uncharacterized protein LOC131937403 [Physella acuta]